ncbi:hypothetical protein K3495_g13887 [Podosphaera aphanis]|nr:hypothetical protein K3495_g13887 [Podosphaera aphanis]
MPSATTAAVGWSVVLLVAGSFYFISNQRKNKNRRTVPAKVRTKSIETRKDQKSKKTRKDVVTQINSEPEARQVSKVQKVSDEKPALSTSQSNKDEIDNREFARQLLNAKVGTVVRPKCQTSSRPKSVKQGRAQEKQRAESSDNTTGNEADDESALNPSIPDIPDIPTVQVAAGDVSDMLEKTPTQPAILKINAPIEVSRPEKQKTAKKTEPIETKKQRQNRQKANEAKLLRAQEEQARKVKMESQRRTAREAEGRAAKDGSSFMASQKPTSSAWTTSPITNEDTATSIDVQLLDTYEPTSNYNITTSEPIYSESDEAGSSRQEIPVLSEEEQVRFAIKETETWSVVKGKEKRNRANRGKENVPSKTVENVVEDLNVNSNNNPQTQPRKIPDTSYSFIEKPNKLYESNSTLEDSEWDVS